VMDRVERADLGKPGSGGLLPKGHKGEWVSLTTCANGEGQRSSSGAAG
jgi:hypothetical protein